MTFIEAVKLRDEYRDILIGKPFENRKDWHIQDVIVCDFENAIKVYVNMFDNKIPNEIALKSVSIKEIDYKVFIVSHQWSWGSGDLLIADVETYLQQYPY